MATFFDRLSLAIQNGKKFTHTSNRVILRFVDKDTYVVSVGVGENYYPYAVGLKGQDPFMFRAPYDREPVWDEFKPWIESNERNYWGTTVKPVQENPTQFIPEGALAPRNIYDWVVNQWMFNRYADLGITLQRQRFVIDRVRNPKTKRMNNVYGVFIAFLPDINASGFTVGCNLHRDGCGDPVQLHCDKWYLSSNGEEVHLDDPELTEYKKFFEVKKGE